jgi:hypothetical protein
MNHRITRILARRMPSGDKGSATAEYAIATMATVGRKGRNKKDARIAPIRRNGVGASPDAVRCDYAVRASAPASHIS